MASWFGTSGRDTRHRTSRCPLHRQKPNAQTSLSQCPARRQKAERPGFTWQAGPSSPGLSSPLRHTGRAGGKRERDLVIASGLVLEAHLSWVLKNLQASPERPDKWAEQSEGTRPWQTAWPRQPLCPHRPESLHLWVSWGRQRALMEGALHVPPLPRES